MINVMCLNTVSQWYLCCIVHFNALYPGGTSSVVCEAGGHVYGFVLGHFK